MDLSLRSPAVVVIPEGWKLGEWATLRVHTWQVPEPEPGFRAAQYARLRSISDWAVHSALEWPVVAIFIEDYAYSRHSVAVTKLAELGGVVRVALFKHGHIAIPVTSSQWRRQLLGKLPRKGAKEAAHRALVSAGAAPYLTNGDACDAYGVANWGLSELGLTALSLA